ncbi:flagellar basal-body rod protein FlgG [Hypnocyclicus thermotrophus]|uniref:Flagellar basal-body rod protein FlgG n=1 Tax=Hypnocyclicus thermotrophus TaxID=1627895 RepID=A0AA46I6H7_9FUSO|nr:flagellar hook-basal body protein [Hypnocyclicus thermotrophus]TDT71801.1 flagellar basal-body rod protein FlgG [Hypnocyclicus thermotrophus]
MLRGIYTSASGMTTQAKKQDTIADNLANINTTGYKKSTTIMEQGKEFDIYRKENVEARVPEREEVKLTKIGKLGTGVKIKENYINFEQGELKTTESNLDFAIKGKGLFAIETDRGIRFSRMGNFSINSEGYLVNHEGDKVLAYNETGKLGYIKPLKDFKIKKNGEIINGDIISEVAINNLNIDYRLPMEEAKTTGNALYIAEFDDTRELTKEGNSYYLADISKSKFSSKSDVYQGYLEMSNVNTVKEMVELINVQRSYETNQKVLSAQDETLDKVVNNIGKWT